jgi:2'-5' RNA ligase
MFEFTSAVVILAPHEVQAIAIPILRQHYPDSLIRFRPHITLMFPFVPFPQLNEACEQLYALCREIPPFEVTLAGYGEFPGVVYMKLAETAPVIQVFHQLYAAFPDYPPYEGRFGDELAPHLTVAQFDGEPERPPIALPAYTPVRFRVDRIHVWYGVRDADLPWLTYDVIPLQRALNPR